MGQAKNIKNINLHETLIIFFICYISEPTKSAEEIFIEECDALYADNDIPKLYELLQKHTDSQNAAILWRLARAACDMGKNVGKDPDKRKFTFEAFEHIKKALAKDENNFAVHKVRMPMYTPLIWDTHRGGSRITSGTLPHLADVCMPLNKILSTYISHKPPPPSPEVQ